MIAANVKLNDGALQDFSKFLADADGAYVKVGVLGSYAARKQGQTGPKRWKSVYSRWSKAAGKYVSSGPSWSASAGAYLTNAEVGVIHEFGAPKAKIPERSFLRMPILSRLGDELKSITLADWQAVFWSGTGDGRGGGLIAVLRVIGQASVNVIQAAFHSGGFGRWAKLQPATIKRKGSSDVLVDTTQLRRSITFAVVSKKG